MKKGRWQVDSGNGMGKRPKESIENNFRTRKYTYIFNFTRRWWKRFDEGE